MLTGSDDRRMMRRKAFAIGAMLFALIVFACCLNNYQGRIASPFEVISCCGLWFQQFFVSIVDPGSMLDSSGLMEFNSSYFYYIDHTVVIFVTAICGMLLALSGSLYQIVFRNPIASPSMLGVSSGVQLGVLVLVVIFGTSATSMGAWRYGLCYSFGIAMLVLLFVLSWLISGRGRPLNIVNMLVIGKFGARF